jgi:hypothetical protein
MQGVRGSNPLSSTRHNASAGLPFRAICQQIVSRSRRVTARALSALTGSGDFGRSHNARVEGDGHLEASETFMVWDDNIPAATITINRSAKPELGSEQERAELTLYSHMVTVDRAYGGQGL